MPLTPIHETTRRKALRIVADAGGTIQSLVFARAMWPESTFQKPKKNRRRKPGVKPRAVTPEARMARQAGTFLSRLMYEGRMVTTVGPQTWAITKEGIAFLNSQDSKLLEKVEARTAPSRERPASPVRTALVTIQGRAYRPHALAHDPRYPQYVSVIWAPNLPPQWVPAACVSWQ